MKLLVVFNPKAAMGRAEKLFPAIEDRLERSGIDARFLITERKGHATELIARTDLSALDGLIAAGGDGSLFEVLNGLYQHPIESRIPLGLIPIGTGNAFARDLGLEPGDWKQGIDLIAGGELRRIDVGQVRTAKEKFHFLNIIGMGFAVDAQQRAKKFKFMGAAAYTLGALWQTINLNSYLLLIEIDGKKIEQDNVFLEISNTRYTGTSFLIAPDAKWDDGLLDLTLLANLPRRRLLRLFPTIYSGSHVKYEEVTTCKAKHIRILGPENMLLAPDGEFRGRTPVEISCLHCDLVIFCDG
jgi:diacylglycerol kinase (ATP)